VLYNLPALILIGIPLFLVFLGGRAIFRRVRKSKVFVEAPEEKEVVKK
jgi:cytochrome c-type biogenesis protein CcmH/NrfF